MSRPSTEAPEGGVQLLMTGTGSLAEAILYTLATCRATSGGALLRVAVAGRNAERGQWLARAANARTAALGTSIQFVAERVDWESSDSIAELLGRTAPVVALHAASLQSPWALGRADPWSRLVAHGGYGVTVSLHAELALRLARAIQLVGSSCLLVNACYPDSVNAMITRLGQRVATGIGNVAILAAFCAADWTAGRSARFRVLANHWHIAQCIKPAPERTGAPRIWLEGAEIGDVAERLAGLRLPSDASLNWVTGATATPLLLAMLGQRESYVGHAPGPLGLPGGYPVTITERDVDLDLPSGLSRHEAVEWNQAAEILDGVSMDEHGFVHYSQAAAAALSEHSSELAAGFAVTDISAVAREMVALRRTLNGR